MLIDFYNNLLLRNPDLKLTRILIELTSTIRL